jgi:hypothetical protein
MNLEQIFDLLAFPAVFLSILTAALTLTARGWRLALILLAIQYLAVFTLVGASWPVGLAAIKLIAGATAATLLWMAALGLPTEARLETFAKAEAGSPPRSTRMDGLADWLGLNWTSRRGSPARPVFRLLAGALAGMAAASFVPAVRIGLPTVSLAEAWGGSMLIALGVLQLGFSNRPLSVIIGILTTLSGFEVIYAAMEQSALVAGLLAVVTVGLALAGAYLITAPHLGTSAGSRPESGE